MTPAMSAHRMHADEVDVDIDLVRRLVAEQFPEWARLELAPVASDGTENALFRLGGDRVVRLPRTASAAAQVEKEHRWLPKVGPSLPLAVPIPLARGAPGDGYPLHASR